jgi:hypothetical protein
MHIQLTLKQTTRQYKLPCSMRVSEGGLDEEPAIRKDRCFASDVSDESKVANWTYERPRWGMVDSTGTNMQQADVKTLEKMVKAYIQMSRGPDIQLVPVTAGRVLEYHIHLRLRHVKSLNEPFYKNRCPFCKIAYQKSNSRLRLMAAGR